MKAIKLSLIIMAVGALAWAVSAQEQTSLNDSPWRLAAQADVKGTGEQISAPSYTADKWYPATVPGTVLTTLVNNRRCVRPPVPAARVLTACHHADCDNPPSAWHGACKGRLTQ